MRVVVLCFSVMAELLRSVQEHIAWNVRGQSRVSGVRMRTLEIQMNGFVDIELSPVQRRERSNGERQ